MNIKRIIGLIILIGGIALIIFAVHSMNRISSAKHDVNALTSPFSQNPVGNVVGGVMKGQASKYDKEVFWCLVGGIVLAVVGAGMAICCRCSHSGRHKK